MELLVDHGPALGGRATTDREEAERQGTVRSLLLRLSVLTSGYSKNIKKKFISRVLLSDPPRFQGVGWHEAYPEGRGDPGRQRGREAQGSLRGDHEKGKSLMIYIWNFHVLNHLLLNYICKLHWKAGGNTNPGWFFYDFYFYFCIPRTWDKTIPNLGWLLPDGPAHAVTEAIMRGGLKYRDEQLHILLHAGNGLNAQVMKLISMS